MSYMTLTSQQKPLFQKIIPFMTPFFTLFVLFAHLRQHCFSKYWGGTNAWDVPPISNFGGDRPPQSPQVSLLVCSRTLNFFLINIDTLILSTGSHYVDSFS